MLHKCHRMDFQLHTRRLNNYYVATMCENVHYARAQQLGSYQIAWKQTTFCFKEVKSRSAHVQP